MARRDSRQKFVPLWQSSVRTGEPLVSGEVDEECLRRREVAVTVYD